ncbi:hypothetical protein IJZ97_01235 [bacterium]|nr:hypothetical protein [bacterium]
MEQILTQNLNLLKEIYKTSLIKNYTDVQEEILQVIVNLTKLEQNNPMENPEIPNSNTTVTYTLIHLDRNKNEFYVYPKREDKFKKAVYEEGNVFVRVFHPDGKIEDCVRKVNRIWQSTVLWNINSMFSEHILNERGEKCHFSKGKKLKVYACPVSCKDSVPNKI